ncbi:MAG TPA: sigma-70 family RNA polymerase sigma factor [Kofleriaceae bacterium]|nr:sigma-70 family RNA polymerase sigma factor [Kofleriaceae bacterium]
MDGESAQLVERHLDLARRAAAIIHPRVREHVSFEELVALANAGLAEAAHRYDPDRGVPFATFAWYRVNGAIVDGLRKATHLPRRTWSKLVALRAASEYLENRAERDRGAAQRGTAPPSGADALAAIKQAMSAIRTMYMTSLETMRDRGFDIESDAPELAHQLDTSRLADRLRRALASLSEKERALVTKHYWEGKNLLEAGAELGMSKSWASRLHAQAVEKLRTIVDAGVDPGVAPGRDPGG